jgi:hypothetical protein
MRKIRSAENIRPWIILGFFACQWLLPAKGENLENKNHGLAIELSTAGSCNPSSESMKMSTWLERDQGPRNVLSELYRKAYSAKEEPDSSELRKTVEVMWVSDKVLQHELSELVQRCGWPTISQYGSEIARSAILIALHAGKAVRAMYLPVVEKASKAKELDPRQYARFIDRALLDDGKEQRYGTQIRPGAQIAPFPIEDESNVDARRTNLGLPSLCTSLELLRRDSGGEIAHTLCKVK